MTVSETQGEGKPNGISVLPASAGITFVNISLAKGYMADSKLKRKDIAKLHSKGYGWYQERRMGLLS